MSSASPHILPVSVVVVNHNAGSLLSECITSALMQAKEVVVVDNASSDGSIADLEGDFASAISGDRLKIIRSEKNLGFAAGCNVGGSVATEGSILFLNPDCILGTDSLQRMFDVLAANPHAGLVGGLLLNPDGTEQGGGRRAIPTPWRSLVRTVGLYRLTDRWPRLFFDFYLHKQPLPEKPVEVEAVSGACMLIKRAALDDVGSWDEGYFLHCEDLDLCMRLRQRGWKIVFVPDAPVIHHIGSCSAARPIFVNWHKHRGMIRFYRKFFRHQYPGVLMWLVTLGVWLRFGAVALYHTVCHLSRKLGLGSG